MDRQQQVERLRQKITGLVREIVLLSTSQVPPEEFFRQFLTRVVSAMDAVAGAVWYVGAERQLRLGAAANLERIRFADYSLSPGKQEAPKAGEGPDTAEDTTEEGASADAAAALGLFMQTVVATVLKQNKPAVLGPSSADPDQSGAAPPLLLTPILVDEQSAGVLLVAPRPGTDPRALRGMVAFMGEVCRQAAVYIQQQRLRAMARFQEHSQHVVALVEQAHASLDPVRVAFAVANMGQTMVGCDRLSMAVLLSRRGRVLAVSGHDVIHRRSALLKRQGALARRVCDWGGTLRNPPPPEAEPPPDRVAAALTAYTQVTTMQSLVVMPLVHEQRPVGALIAESKDGDALGGAHVARLTMVARHGAPALANAVKYHRLPLLRALGVVKAILGRLFGRTVPRVVRRLALMAAPVLALIFVPWELTVRAPVNVTPEESRIAYAQASGIIREVLVTEGQQVSADEVLARMRDSSLQEELRAAKADLGIQEAVLRALQAQSNPESIRQLKVQQFRVEKCKAMVAFVERRLEKTRVLAPISGTVLTQDPEDLQEKPVERGAALFRVAHLTGAWVLEIDLPENEAGHVLAAQRRLGRPLTVTFYLAAFPQRRFRTTLREIARQAEIVGQKNVVRLTADLPNEVRDQVKPQMCGEARVHCGQRPLGYVLFRGVIDFVRTHVTF